MNSFLDHLKSYNNIDLFYNIRSFQSMCNASEYYEFLYQNYIKDDFLRTINEDSLRDVSIIDNIRNLVINKFFMNINHIFLNLCNDYISDMKSINYYFNNPYITYPITDESNYTYSLLYNKKFILSQLKNARDNCDIRFIVKTFFPTINRVNDDILFEDSSLLYRPYKLTDVEFIFNDSSKNILMSLLSNDNKFDKNIVTGINELYSLIIDVELRYNGNYEDIITEIKYYTGDKYIDTHSQYKLFSYNFDDNNILVNNMIRMPLLS